jgi:predicted MPP superfamily phosphohydrolase
LNSLNEVLEIFLHNRILFSFVNVCQVSGLHRIRRVDGGEILLYTNRGLATHPPFRLFCPPEVTLFELEP